MADCRRAYCASRRRDSAARSRLSAMPVLALTRLSALLLQPPHLLEHAAVLRAQPGGMTTGDLELLLEGRCDRANLAQALTQVGRVKCPGQRARSKERARTASRLEHSLWRAEDDLCG